MSEVSHKKCPFCGHRECFSYNTENGLFSCFSCDATPSRKRGLCFDGNTLEPFKYEKDDGEVNLETYIPDSYRGIRKETFEKDGLVYFTKTDKGDIANFIYPHATKTRKIWLDKANAFQASGKLDKLMGIEEYGSGGKYITITEGEWDRYSVMQMMGDWPVANVPAASPSKQFWSNTVKDLAGFEKIILSVDKDEAGDKLAEKFYRLFPGKVYRVDHGKYKDANEFLQAGGLKEYKASWWNAQKVKPESILVTKEDFIKLYEDTPDYEYFPTGIPKLDEKMLGIHKGAFTLIVAPTGIGKTEFMRYLEWKALSETKYTIASCHLEETKLRSLLGLVSYEQKDNLTRKDLIDKKDAEGQVLQSIENITKEERYYHFSLSESEGPDDLIEQIRLLVTAFGVDYIFFEPIQDIVHGDTSTKESLLTDLSNRLKLLAPEINVGIVVIAHANEDGDPKYCRSIVQSAAYEIVLSRDPDAEEEEERNRTYVSVGRKNRTGGGSGPCGALVFNTDTYMIEPDLTGLIEPKVETKITEDIPF